MLQSSYFDPVLGLDIHIVLMPTPAGPVPTPVPQPFVGLVFDPVGLAMGAAIGMALGGGPGLVLVNNLPVTNAGTAVTNLLTLPHLPVPGVAFAKGKPGNDAELFFGSLNVSLGGSLGVRLGDIALSCSDPVRLPTSLVLAIPKGPPVLNNPAMVPDVEAIAQRLMMAVGMRALKAAARRGARLFRTLRAAQRKSRGWSKVSGALRSVVDRIAPQRYRDRLKRAVCFVTGHPVDVATGRLFTDHVDFELPGPLPLVFERVYSSSLSWRNGPLGYGWSHSLDQAVWVERGKVVYLAEDGREVEFHTDALPDRVLRTGQSLFDVTNGLTLRALDSSHWEIETDDGRVYLFAPVAGGPAHRAMLVRIRSRDGHHNIRLAYDERGLLDTVRDSADRLIGFVHDSSRRLSEVKLPLSRESGWYRHLRYVYDDHGDLVEVVDAMGHSWTFEYQGHLLVQETDRGGLSFYFQYDGVGPSARCVRTWGDGGIFDHLISYDTRNRKTVVEDSLGHTTLFQLNELGMVVKVTDPHGATTEYAYDEGCGKLTREAAALGRTRAITYDARGQVVAVQEPDGSTSRLEYDARGLPVRMTDSLGGIWTWSYDAEGHPTQRLTPTGEKTAWGWRNGLLTWVELPGGRRSTLNHDAQKNVMQLRAPNGAVLEYDHDGLGRLRRVKDARGAYRRFQHDVLGRLVRIEAPLGHVQSLSYDAEGNLLEVRNATRHVRLRYGHLHRVMEREEAGTKVRFDYDTEGRLSGVVNEAGERHEFELDARGRVLVERGFDGFMRRYVRDAAGRLTTLLMPSGRSTELAYDACDRITDARHSDGTFAHFEYRLDGVLTLANNESTEVRLECDALGRVVRELQDGVEVRSHYGKDGERGLIETSLGARASITRDTLGAVAAIHLGPEALQQMPSTIYFQRDALGQELSRVLPGGIQVDWKHDLAGRPTERRTRQSTGSMRELETRTFQWQGEEQLVAILDGKTAPRSFDYDARGRLVRERRDDRVIERAMDAVGNLFRHADRRDRRYGRGGRLEQADGIRYDHDPDGRLEKKVEPDGSTWHYHWNGHGVLREVERPDGLRVRFEYDPFARRTRKQLVRASSEGTKTVESETRFVWDGSCVAHELDSEDGLTTWYWEPDSYVPLAKEKGRHRWTIASDQLGTPTEMYDELGQLAWKMQLDIFGIPSFETGKSSDCPWRWPGQYEDEHARLSYNGWRYYSPEDGGYISQDPLRLLGGLRSYGYVLDPLRACDPSGLFPLAIPHNQGHHLVPHAVATHVGLSPFNSQFGVPSFYFEPNSPGNAHDMMHGYNNTVPGSMPSNKILSYTNRGLTPQTWLESLRDHYQRPELQHLRGDVALVAGTPSKPSKGLVLASNVSPAEAWQIAMDWAERQDPNFRGCR